MLVLPLYSFGEDAAICCSLVRVSGLLVERVRGLELSPVVSVAISDHNLRGVLVGHDDGGLGQLGSRGRGVVWHERLLAHARVLNLVDSVRRSMDKCKETVSNKLAFEIFKRDEFGRIR